MNTSELLSFGQSIVKEISSKIVIAAKERSLGDLIGSSGASGDLTKFADEYSEQIVKEILNKYVTTHPNEKIVLISEEIGIYTVGETTTNEGCFLILDPLDGSNNLRPWKTPSPYVGIGLALGSLQNLAQNNNFDAIEVGIAGDIFNNRMYYATKNTPASASGFGDIATSPETEVSKAIIGIDLDVQADKYDKLLPKVEQLMREKKCFRRLGSSILDFMKVAAGEYDAFVSVAGRMGFYDIAAVKLIVEKAGGTFTIVNGGMEQCIIKSIIDSNDASLLNTVKYSIVCAGNKQLEENLLAVIK